MSDIPTLVLPGFEEPEPNAPIPNAPAGGGAKSELSLSSLTPEEQNAVLNFSKQINIMDQNTVAQYGTSAQNKIAQFSDSVLQNIRTSDTGEVGKCLTDLVVELKGFDSSVEEKGGLRGLFGGVKKSLEKMQANYAKVEVNIDKIQNQLETHQRILIKDIAMFDKMYESNLSYYKELTMYIIAGEEKLQQFREKDIAAQRAKAESANDQMEVQKLNDMESLAERFEKKLHDLKLSRIVSIQMAPQIRLLQNNNSTLADKIQSSIVNSIPIWKSQLVLTLGIARSKSALEAQTKVTDYTNVLLQKNSELLRQGSIDVAKESERSIISIETIKKTNENLISTITDVLQIQEQGRQDRASAEKEMESAEEELKAVLLRAKKR
ncbi:MAG: toxic anion resistance protein [Clostridiales bacterium]|jgi:uncharacterized protein YaaN involved in tellurite resistance|nr:toxic anion resistance protein [Clostridiales bacterium]